MELVAIYWSDALSINDTVTLANAKTMVPIPSVTIGYLLENTEQKVVVAQSHFSETEYSPELYKGLFVIPKGMIEKIEVIRE